MTLPRARRTASASVWPARCKGTPNPEIWQSLVRWREASPYRASQHQWLEELVTPALLGQWDEVEFDLYLPIAE